ncbi:phenylalanine--tRNA ligase subunit alpha [Candidatus Epulonipiscium fishelsonii]|uniref:Phenylalanine--tRNA ligase subunit alpha n=1 Tax=Candidatus Epulonipiscium fishelsonii TaxID=77094 RepID=A0ACC8XCW2_9FIRM|nr:phenylalanine--tRNA ligase subunit alpha [Epulopiscium sp. SCG-B11WGA-EpuloA1]ONI41786.1 phenylalanine--tRNA ligase subunit alpha [Epulopiscium sp. SCG-B05WGA-EpuloA1]ONI47892.1 phenylalanine--tRNA ligase subunit alpha [Epulopiscium sp. SCG-C06WGA-EpuloA1]
MNENLENIKVIALEEITNAEDLKTLDDLRVKYLGKKGELTLVLKSMKNLSTEERPIVGQMANEIRGTLERAIQFKKVQLELEEENKSLQDEVIDVTMPTKKVVMGHMHPLEQTLEEIKRIFMGMGYEIAEGREVETDYYNFDALNLGKDHAARDEQDTFYITENIVLRTATSPVQVHTMETKPLPIRIVAPGKVYRSDEVDATHSPVFHQIEGLVIDKNITFGDLKGVLAEFAKRFFGDKVEVKFRPHYFPFTEPSAEVDVTCIMCQGEGCSICKGEGWIEVLGCGMVHPKVLEMSGIDPSIYQGFAFGMGVERLTMLKYNINDIRLFYENDIRFLNQF